MGAGDRHSVALRDDLQFVRTGDEGVVYDHAAGQVHVLNPTGATFWELLAQGLDPDQAAQRIAADHDQPPDRVREDVAELLDDLRSRGLLIESPQR